MELKLKVMAATVVVMVTFAVAADEPWFGAPIPASGEKPGVADCGMSAAKVFDAPIEGLKRIGTLAVPEKEVSYGSDPQQTGDLFLPAKVTPETPFVLNIHGGGWSAMSRKDAAGVSAFLVERGCAVYSVDYRLASKENPWPACGDDCLKAAEFILRGGFAAQGLTPSRIWIIGVSAGGHLALWTGMNLKAEQVAGIISVSGIADPIPDAKANPNRYVRLFGGREPTASDLDSMSIMKLVRKNGPRILLTHAREDTVVPVESAANFCNAYRNAGNNILFYQYSEKDEANTGGHAIWRKDYPVRKRLLNCIENEIAPFIGISQKCSPQSTQSSL